MNDAHIHLLTNHLPILIPVVGVLIMIGGFLFSAEILKRAAYCLFILGAITANLALATGERSEDTVEQIPGIDKKMIHEHEERAEAFSNTLYALSGLSLLGLWASWKKKKFSNIVAYVSLAFMVVVLYYAKVTGTSGGEIRHTEIRGDSTGQSDILNIFKGEDDDD